MHQIDPMLALLRALPPTRRPGGSGGLTIIRTSGPNGAGIEIRSGNGMGGDLGNPAGGLGGLLFGMPPQFGRMNGMGGMGGAPPNMSYEELLSLAEQLGMESFFDGRLATMKRC